MTHACASTCTVIRGNVQLKAACLLGCGNESLVPAQAIRPGAVLVAIHDSARPLVQADDVRKCMADALQVLQAQLFYDCVWPESQELVPLREHFAGLL